MEDSRSAPPPSRGRLARASLFMGLTTVGAALSGLVRMKLLAVTVGPEGVGVYGQLAGLQQVVGIVAAFGLTAALVRELAAQRAAGWGEETTRHFGQVGAVQLLTALASLVGLVAFARPIAGAFFGDHAHATAVRIAAIGVPGTLIAGLLQNVAVAAGSTRRYVFALLFEATLTTLLAVALLLWRGLFGAQVYLAAGPWLSVTVALIAFARDLPLGSARAVARACTRLDRAVLWPYLVFGASVAASYFLRQATGLGVRSLLFRTLDDRAAGLYQAGFALSSYYVTFFNQPLLNIAYPGFSAAGSPEASRPALLRWLDLVGSVVPLLLVVYVVALPLLIPLLNSQKFVGTVPIAAWLAAGDFFYVVFFLLRLHLLAHRRIGPALLLEALFDGLVLAFTAIAIRFHGAAGAGQAHCAAAAIALVAASWNSFSAVLRVVALPAAGLLGLAFLVDLPAPQRLAAGGVVLLVLAGRLLLGGRAARLREIVARR